MNTLWYFFLYSFLGWCLEGAYARGVRRSASLRRCRLLLPLCPVYGAGALAILSLPEDVKRSGALLFLAGTACATAAEYAASAFYERAWGVSFWDYSGLPGSVKGRVCLPFSLCWGALALVLVHLVHPAVRTLAEHLPRGALPFLVSLFLSDTAVTTVLLRKSGTKDALRWFTSPPALEGTQS